MATVVATYDAKDCVVTVGPEDKKVFITGFGEDMVSFSKEEAYFEPKVGAKGDIVKNVTNNPIHTMTLTLQPTSPQKNYMMNLARTGAVFPIWCENAALKERFGGSQASIQEMPEIARGTEADDMEFTICVFDGVVEELD